MKHHSVLNAAKSKASGPCSVANTTHTPEMMAAASKAGSPIWPSFTGAATLVGTTPSGRLTVYYDATLGAQALLNAQSLLAAGDLVCAQNDGVFGTTGGHVDAIVVALGGATDGSGGADHMGCDYSTGAQIEVCASYGSPARVIALFEAELSECSMNGQLCGYSTGEALSRWCSMAVSNNALSDFATVPTWIGDGMADWVDKTEDTDQDPDSIGCGMAFISWLLKLGHTLPAIARAMVSNGDSGTLSQLYNGLTGVHAGETYNSFMNAIKNVGYNNIKTDDPFKMLASVVLTDTPLPASGSPTPTPVPNTAPVPVPNTTPNTAPNTAPTPVPTPVPNTTPAPAPNSAPNTAPVPVTNAVPVEVFFMPHLPTSDPHVPDQVWNDDGVLTVSKG